MCAYCIFCVNCVFYVFLQYFDTVGWVLWPVKIVAHINCTVLAEMLNHAQLINQLSLFLFTVLLFHYVQMKCEGHITKASEDCRWVNRPCHWGPLVIASLPCVVRRRQCRWLWRGQLCSEPWRPLLRGMCYCTGLTKPVVSCVKLSCMKESLITHRVCCTKSAISAQFSQE